MTTLDSMVEPRPERGMSEEEKALSQTIYAAVQDYSNRSVRSLQSADFVAGVSDLGWCSEYLRRMLDEQTPEDVEVLPAFLGTAIGDHVEKAIAAKVPSAIIQAEVVLELRGESGQVYKVPGHPDIVLPEEGILLDGKAPFGLALARRLGADQQKQFQRHGYAKAAHDAGLFPNHALEDVRVGNVWIDRSGVEKELHVQLERFDPGVIDAMALWVDEAVYAYVNGTEARKEPAREVCAVTCGFFGVCRAHDTDVEGRLTDPEVVAAIEAYAEGKALEKRGRQQAEQMRGKLRDYSGSTGQYALRWTWINPTEIKGFERRGYYKIDVQDLKR